MKCSVCGSERYTKHGNTSSGRWSFICENRHTWAQGSINDPFPWLDDDPNHPDNYAYDLCDNYRRKDDPAALFSEVQRINFRLQGHIKDLDQ